MKCWKCKKQDYNPSHRNKVEKVISFVLPIRPYRCDSCDFRFYGPISPLFNRSRAISAAVMGLFFVLFMVNAFVSFDVDEPVPKTGLSQENASEGSEADNLLANAPASPPEASQSSGATSENPTDETSIDDEEPVVEEDLSGHSDFVKTQLARNRGIAAGEEPPTVISKKKETLKVKAKPKTAAPQGIAVSGGKINAVSFKLEGNEFRLEIVTDRPVSVKKQWFDKKAPKLVVNLQGSWSLKKGLQTKLPVDDSLVKRVRLGSHPKFFTVVLDLNTAKAGKVNVAPGDKGLVVTLSKLK